MRKVSFRLAVLLIAALCTLPACGGRLLRLRLPFISVNLLVDEEVESDLHDKEGTLETESIIGKVLGEDLLFTNGELKMGERSYGTLKDGDTIEIKQTGILVNGETRGPLKN